MMKPPQAGNVSEQRVEHQHTDGHGRDKDREPALGLGIVGTDQAQGVKRQEHHEEPWHRQDDESTSSLRQRWKLRFDDHRLDRHGIIVPHGIPLTGRS